MVLVECLVLGCFCLLIVVSVYYFVGCLLVYFGGFRLGLVVFWFTRAVWLCCIAGYCIVVAYCVVLLLLL